MIRVINKAHKSVCSKLCTLYTIKKKQTLRLYNARQSYDLMTCWNQEVSLTILKYDNYEEKKNLITEIIPKIRHKGDNLHIILIIIQFYNRNYVSYIGFKKQWTYSTMNI